MPLGRRSTPERGGAGPYVYTAEILESLWRHGVHPSPITPPELVHAFVGDLHRYELRRLRNRLLNKDFPKPEYYARVVEIRNRYRLLALKPHELVQEPTTRDAQGPGPDQAPRPKNQGRQR